MKQKDPQHVIFRDDDVGRPTPISNIANLHKMFVEAHELYNKYNVIHEIGYITNGPKEHMSDTIKYILEQKNIVVQLHGHDHYDFSKLSEKELRYQFENGIKSIQDIFGTAPTRWYPPWHKTSELAIQIASEYGLRSTPIQAGSIGHFVTNYRKYIKQTPVKIVCHHFWSDHQQAELENGFKIYINILKEHYDIELMQF
jgi:hypothetical protein